MTFWEYINRGRDPNAVAVLLEDSAALLGVLIAAGSLGATYLTGNSAYDAAGSIAVGGRSVVHKTKTTTQNIAIRRLELFS